MNMEGIIWNAAYMINYIDTNNSQVSSKTRFQISKAFVSIEMLCPFIKDLTIYIYVTRYNKQSDITVMHKKDIHNLVFLRCQLHLFILPRYLR